MWQSFSQGLVKHGKGGQGTPDRGMDPGTMEAGEVAKATGPGHNNVTNWWRVFGSPRVNFIYSSMGSGEILLFDHHATEKCIRQQDKEKRRDWILLLMYVLNSTAGCSGEAAVPRLRAAACAMANSGLGLEIGQAR